MSNFSKADIQTALADLGMLRYWPSEPETRAAIGARLAKIVPSREALVWLTEAMIRDGEWRGPAEMLDLLSQRFKPAAGLESDGEEGYFERCDAEYQKQLATWRREAKYLPEPEKHGLLRQLMAASRMQ